MHGNERIWHLVQMTGQVPPTLGQNFKLKSIIYQIIINTLLSTASVDNCSVHFHWYICLIPHIAIMMQKSCMSWSFPDSKNFIT